MTDKEQLITKLTDLEKFALIGWIYTKDTKNAYEASRKMKLTCTPESLVAQSSKWLNLPKCQAFIEVEQARRFKAVELDSNESGTRSREDVIRDLNLLANQETEPKRKSEILMKLADLEQMKKTEEAPESEQIKYYLPLKCSQCALYKQAKEKQTSKKK